MFMCFWCSLLLLPLSPLIFAFPISEFIQRRYEYTERVIFGRGLMWSMTNWKCRILYRAEWDARKKQQAHPYWKYIKHKWEDQGDENKFIIIRISSSELVIDRCSMFIRFCYWQKARVQARKKDGKNMLISIIIHNSRLALSERKSSEQQHEEMEED